MYPDGTELLPNLEPFLLGPSSCPAGVHVTVAAAALVAVSVVNWLVTNLVTSLLGQPLAMLASTSPFLVRPSQPTNRWLSEDFPSVLLQCWVRVLSKLEPFVPGCICLPLPSRRSQIPHNLIFSITSWKSEQHSRTCLLDIQPGFTFYYSWSLIQLLRKLSSVSALIFWTIQHKFTFDYSWYSNLTIGKFSSAPAFIFRTIQHRFTPDYFWSLI